MIKNMMADLVLFAKWTKWAMIILQSEFQGISVVNFFGTRYIIAGNVVKKFGS